MPPETSSPQHLTFPDARMVTSSEGAALALYDLGGDGPDVLMVHATGFCAGVWGPLARHLPQMRRTALDVRGHGRSELPVSGTDWTRAAGDVLDAVDHLGLDRPFGVGHSMGGALLAMAELERPGTFSGLWLYEPIILPAALVEQGGDGSNPLAEGARRRRERFDSADEALENFSSKPPLDSLHPDALRAYVEHAFATDADGSVVLRCAPATEASNYESGGRHRTFERLGELACPTAVLRGVDAAPGPASVAPALAQAMPAARLEEHPELGHFGPLEDPEAMAASVRAAVTPRS